MTIIGIEIPLWLDYDFGAMYFKLEVSIYIVEVLAFFPGDKNCLLFHNLLVDSGIFDFNMLFQLLKLRVRNLNRSVS